MVLRIMIDEGNTNRGLRGAWRVPIGQSHRAHGSRGCLQAQSVGHQSPRQPAGSAGAKHHPAQDQRPTGSTWGRKSACSRRSTAGSRGARATDGPAGTSADELFWLDDSTLAVATFGRGMFKTTIGPGTVQLTASSLSVAETAAPRDFRKTARGGMPARSASTLRHVAGDGDAGRQLHVHVGKPQLGRRRCFR
jgi:hypothetical protein